MIGAIVWLIWWIGGWIFALSMWEIEFGDDDIVPTATFAFIGCMLFGPIVGLLWWPSKKAWAKRERRKQSEAKHGKLTGFASDEELAARWRAKYPEHSGKP